MKIDLKFRNMDADVKVEKYVDKKIGRLSRFVPKVQRDVAVARVILEKDPNGREQNRYECEVIMDMVGADIVAKDATVNVYAAIDIVEAKLKTQLVDYKEKTSPKQSRLRQLNQWRKRLPSMRRARREDAEAAELEAEE
jgi:putative sigma-54 modulation protein